MSTNDRAWANFVNAAIAVVYANTQDSRVSEDECEIYYEDLRRTMADLRARGVCLEALGVDMSIHLPSEEPPPTEAAPDEPPQNVVNVLTQEGAKAYALATDARGASLFEKDPPRRSRRNEYVDAMDLYTHWRAKSLARGLAGTVNAETVRADRAAYWEGFASACNLYTKGQSWRALRRREREEPWRMRRRARERFALIWGM